MRKLNGHKEHIASVLLCDVTAYAEVFTEPLLRNGLHNPLVLLLRALLSNGCSVAQPFLHGANTP
jgi:hypothetical protein